MKAIIQGKVIEVEEKEKFFNVRLYQVGERELVTVKVEKAKMNGTKVGDDVVVEGRVVAFPGQSGKYAVIQVYAGSIK
ncbi:MAG: hypothetical protein ACPL5F_01035 [Moorellaceae bacterium]